jgi:hypothetical protein
VALAGTAVLAPVLVPVTLLGLVVGAIWLGQAVVRRVGGLFRRP